MKITFSYDWPDELRIRVFYSRSQQEFLLKWSLAEAEEEAEEEAADGAFSGDFSGAHAASPAVYRKKMFESQAKEWVNSRYITISCQLSSIPIFHLHLAYFDPYAYCQICSPLSASFSGFSSGKTLWLLNLFPLTFWRNLYIFFYFRAPRAINGSKVVLKG